MTKSARNYRKVLRIYYKRVRNKNGKLMWVEKDWYTFDQLWTSLQ